MKKIVFFLSVLITLSLDAQQNITLNRGLVVDNNALAFPYQPKLGIENEAKTFNTEAALLQSLGNNGGTSPMTSKSNPLPTNTIQSRLWGSFTNFETNAAQLFQMNYQFGAGANFKIKLLDSELNPTNEFSIAIPTTTNAISLISKISNFNFEGNTKRKFMIFLHYFEGGVGPNFQKNAVWLFDEDGAILHKFEGVTSTYYVKDANGSTNILSSIDDSVNVLLKLYNTSAFQQLASIQIESKFFTNYAGVPLNFINIGGKHKIVVCHYEKKYMDNATGAVEPNNHLLMKIFDLNLNFEKQMLLPVPEVAPGSSVFGLMEFGMFYNNNKYDITDHVFNTDDKFEILYAVNWQDLNTDTSWRNYYVADETGATLKSFEESIVGFSQMNEVAGQEDQMSFILGEGDAGSSIRMFDIKSWNSVFDFPAVYNGDQLSVYYNRIPNNATYQYLIGLDAAQTQNGTYYGVVNKYSPAGILEGNVRLNIGTAPDFFIPLLNEDTLNPLTFNPDQAFEYAYVYGFRYPGNNVTYTSFNVAKDFTDPTFTINGETVKGNVYSSGFLYRADGSPYKLFINYSKTGVTQNLTEFYSIPLETVLNTNEAAVNTVKVYTDKLHQVAGFSEVVKEFEVYNASGSLIKKGDKTSNFSTTGWAKGMYIIKFTTNKNKVEATKILIQ